MWLPSGVYRAGFVGVDGSGGIDRDRDFLGLVEGVVVDGDGDFSGGALCRGEVDRAVFVDGGVDFVALGIRGFDGGAAGGVVDGDAGGLWLPSGVYRAGFVGGDGSGGIDRDRDFLGSVEGVVVDGDGDFSGGALCRGEVDRAVFVDGGVDFVALGIRGFDGGAAGGVVDGDAGGLWLPSGVYRAGFVGGDSSSFSDRDRDVERRGYRAVSKFDLDRNLVWF